MGSPNLTREEGLLALRAYRWIGSGASFSDQHEAIQWLSRVLQKLDIHDSPEVSGEFRSPDGLASRVRQFRWLEEGRREDVAQVYHQLWDEYDGDWESVDEDAREVLRRHEVDSALISQLPSDGEPSWVQSIEYVTPSRSDFYEPVREALEKQVDGFVMRETVDLTFDADKDGYPGNVLVDIDPRREESFRTDWSGSDPTRFPARIRAAATALRDAQRFGIHRILHESGDLLVEPLRSN